VSDQHHPSGIFFSEEPLDFEPIKGEVALRATQAVVLVIWNQEQL